MYDLGKMLGDILGSLPTYLWGCLDLDLDAEDGRFGVGRRIFFRVKGYMWRREEPVLYKQDGPYLEGGGGRLGFD